MARRRKISRSSNRPFVLVSLVCAMAVAVAACVDTTTAEDDKSQQKGSAMGEKVVKTDHFEVQPGQVRGLKQVARGYADDGEFLTLTFIAALDEGDEGDAIVIRGKPDLEVRLKGTNGDIATIAIAVNAIRRVKAAPPGLVTMRDLPIVTLW